MSMCMAYMAYNLEHVKTGHIEPKNRKEKSIDTSLYAPPSLHTVGGRYATAAWLVTCQGQAVIYSCLAAWGTLG